MRFFAQNRIKNGDCCARLSPTISITILAYDELPEITSKYHTVFDLRERGEGFAFGPDIQLHFIEMQKYQMLKQQGKISQPPIDPHDSLLNHWVCLFNLNKATEQDIYALSEVPEMVEVFRALNEISQDPHLRQLAAAYDKIRTEEIFLTNDARARGLAIGFNQGLTLEQVKESMDSGSSN